MSSCPGSNSAPPCSPPSISAARSAPIGGRAHSHAPGRVHVCRPPRVGMGKGRAISHVQRTWVGADPPQTPLGFDSARLLCILVGVHARKRVVAAYVVRAQEVPCSARRRRWNQSLPRGCIPRSCALACACACVHAHSGSVFVRACERAVQTQESERPHVVCVSFAREGCYRRHS